MPERPPPVISDTSSFNTNTTNHNPLLLPSKYTYTMPKPAPTIDPNVSNYSQYPTFHNPNNGININNYSNIQNNPNIHISNISSKLNNGPPTFIGYNHSSNQNSFQKQSTKILGPIKLNSQSGSTVNGISQLQSKQLKQQQATTITMQLRTKNKMQPTNKQTTVPATATAIASAITTKIPPKNMSLSLWNTSSQSTITRKELSNAEKLHQLFPVLPLKKCKKMLSNKKSQTSNAKLKNEVCFYNLLFFFCLCFCGFFGIFA